MQYLGFQKYFSSYYAFSIKEIEKVFPNFNKQNLLTWQQKDYLLKLRNGFYTLKNRQKSEYELFLIANKIYAPSYVSLESALSFYGVIPESVFSITSVSTLKTNAFQNQIGSFDYKNVKSNLFFGYRLMQVRNYFCKMAELEKCILDYLYLKSHIKTLEDINAMRFNTLVLVEELDVDKLDAYAQVFSSKVLLKKVTALKKLINA